MSSRDRDGQHAASETTVERALLSALGHARNALAEGILSARALLDAASITLTGHPAKLDARSVKDASDARLALGAMARGLDDLAHQVRSAEGPLPAPVLEAVLAALDAEITRWEQRSTHDADARAVLRAFLGLREILWELGVRRPPSRETSNEATPDGTVTTESGASERADPTSDQIPAADSDSVEALEPAYRGDVTDGSDIGDSGPRVAHMRRPRVQRIEVKG
jgi:hypothetical protein